MAAESGRTSSRSGTSAFVPQTARGRDKVRRMTRVTVVGGGVIGLTCALELARAGHAVTVLAADAPEATTSAVAAALWFPYAAAPAGRRPALGPGVAGALRGARRTTRPPASALREGTVVYRAPDPDLGWTRVVPGCAPASVLPAGATSGVRCRLPVIEMDVYLGWLPQQARDAGAAVVRRRVERLDDARRRGRARRRARRPAPLAGDGTAFPIRGQVVRLANPGLTDWLGRRRPPGRHDLRRAAVGRRRLRRRGRARRRRPRRRSRHGGGDPRPRAGPGARRSPDAPVVSRGVGLRPARPAVRLERDGDVIHCYGHGGAGVTLSWGCAEDVVALIA